MKRKLLSIVLTLSLTGALLSGCGNAKAAPEDSQIADDSKSDDTENTEATDSTEDSGDQSTGGGNGGSITVPSITTVSTLDQTLSSIDADMGAIGVFSTGLYRDTEDGFVLDLAEKEDVSEDGLTRTYTIREDAKWSDGEPIKADDFVYSWRRLADPNTGAEYAFFLLTIGVKNASEVLSGELPVEELGVSAPDEKTFVVETDHYVPYFAEIVRFVQFNPLRQDVVEAAGDQYGLSKESVLSSSTWVVSDWQPGSETISYVRNDQYYDPSVTNLDEFTYQTISDSQTAYMAYENGDIDYLSLSGDLVDLLRDSDEFTTLTSKQIHYLEPNLKNEYLSNVNIRKAIAYAINKQSIADDILKNGSIPADFIVPTVLGKDSSGKSFREFTGNKTYYEYDTDKALEYWNKGLEELGVSEISFEILYDDTAAQGDIAQFLQATLQETLPGLTITLQQQPKKNRLELMTSGDYDLGLTKWGADYDDPSTFLDLFRGDASYNHSGYSNKEYEEALDKAASDDLLDVDKRYADYNQAEEILFEELPAIPVYQDGNAFVIKADLDIPVGTNGLYQVAYTKRK